MEAVKLNTSLIPMLLGLPSNNVWIDFDREADVLYISYKKPQQANDSVMEDDGNIYNYRDSQLVGITVINASRYIKNN